MARVYVYLRRPLRHVGMRCNYKLMLPKTRCPKHNKARLKSFSQPIGSALPRQHLHGYSTPTNQLEGLYLVVQLDTHPECVEPSEPN